MTAIGAGVDLVLGTVKIIVGHLAHSQALIADGVHSLSDLITDFLVIWAAKQASRKPDAAHPYGHQRIETVTSILLGLMLAAVAVGIGIDAVLIMLHREDLNLPGIWALVIATLSVLLKEIVYHYTLRAAERLNSDLLRSNAWHSRSDALSSIVVIIGVAGTMLGFTYLDAAAAVVVAGMIVVVGGKLVWNGIKELIDTAVESEQVDAILATVREVEGVEDVHELRTRRMGGDIYLDGHVLVTPQLSVSEGHRIGEEVRARLKQRFADMADITIHIDAEDDTAYQRSAHLPLRRELEQELKDCWAGLPEADAIECLVVHYVDGSLQIETWLPLSRFDDIAAARQAATRLREAAMYHAHITRVEVLFR